MVYIIISLIALFISFSLFKKVSGTMKINQLNMYSLIFYWQLFLMCFIGVNLALYGLDHHYIISGKVKDDHIKVITYFSVLYVMVALPASMLLVNKICKFNPLENYKVYYEGEIETVISDTDTPVFFTLTLLAFVCLLSIFYTFYIIGTIPIMHIFSGKSSFELAQLRQQVSRGFDGIAYIKNIFGIHFTPLLSYIVYVYKEKYKDLKWNILFYILVILSILIVTYDLSKAPLLMYILGFIILRVLIKKEIKTSTILILGSSLAALIVTMYFVFYGVKDLSFFSKLNQGPLGRVIFTQIAGLYLHFQYFPDVEPYLAGASFPNLITRFFGIESIRSARVVMALANPEGVENGTAGVMNTLFIGEAYANFGWLGMFFSVIYVGIVIQLINILFIKYFPKNPITIGIFAYLTVLISRTITGGFIDFIYNPLLICIVILYFIIVFTSRILDKIIHYFALHHSKG